MIAVVPMNATQATEVTRLLGPASRGEEAAAATLLPLVYDQLRELAGRELRKEAPGHMLQPTALVHEAYLRLVDQTRVDWQGRTHFMAVAAMTIRRILVDHARKKAACKRGGSRPTLVLDETIAVLPARELNLVALDEALSDLAQFDERESRVVELRFFAGLTEQEVAAHLGVSERTVREDWRHARVWLRRRLEEGLCK
ncbi:MAG: sigma-70 family RNA polymerase sigma factor [Planctomycetota bacterium]